MNHMTIAMGYAPPVTSKKGVASVSHAGAAPADWRNSRSGIEAMGVRLGLGPWDQGVHRLLSQYEAAVEAALAATRTTAEA